MQNKNPLIKKELFQVTIFFVIVMSVYIIRAAFDFFLLFVVTGWDISPFLAKLLQDIFYMIWDLPIVLPPLIMHYLNYRPQFKLLKEEAAEEVRSFTIVEDGYVTRERGSFANRPAWLKEMATIDSINRMNNEDMFESLGIELYNAVEAPKNLTFEITNEAYEYSGLLRRMMESNRDETSTVGTEDQDQGQAAGGNYNYIVSGVSSN